ncbi:MAG TPA: hypothetical protein VFH24_02270, partial [Gemmatimonadales bacterium]|nr:hypothetical protein [Gemmatimonadales bacterium]
MDGPLDLSNQVTQEDKTSFEQTEYQEGAIGIRPGDLSRQGTDPFGNRPLIEDDRLDRTAAGAAAHLRGLQHRPEAR